jgi:hypothetical protein
MLECRCQTEAADNGKKCRCRSNFFPAFRHLHMIFQYNIARYNIRSCLWTCRLYPFPQRALWTCMDSLLPPPVSMNVQGVSYSNSAASSMDNGHAGHIPLHQHQYGLAGCVPFHSQQGRARCNQFHSQEYGRAVRAGCMCFHCQQYVMQDVCLSFTSSMELQGAPLF